MIFKILSERDNGLEGLGPEMVAWMMLSIHLKKQESRRLSRLYIGVGGTHGVSLHGIPRSYTSLCDSTKFRQRTENMQLTLQFSTCSTSSAEKSAPCVAQLCTPIWVDFATA